MLNKIKDKSITRNIFRIQNDDSIMCGFYCIAFIEYMLPGKFFFDYTNLFSPYDYKKMARQYISILTTNIASLEFILKKIDETRNHLLEEIKHNDLMSEKHKTSYKYSYYIKPLLILASTNTGCVSVSAFASLASVFVGIASSTVGIKICAITPGIKKCKSSVKKKNKKKHDKIALLGKAKLDTIEVLISQALIDSYISYREFV